MVQPVLADDIPVDRAVALDSQAPDMPAKDPADRFIAATARIHGLTLLTHDRQMLDSPAVPTLAHGPAGVR